MNINDVKKHYQVKTNIELAQILSVTNVTVSNWRKSGIPYERQCVLYFESKHKLKPRKSETSNV